MSMPRCTAMPTRSPVGDPEVGQPVRQRRHGRLELAVGERRRSGAQRRSVWRRRDLRAEQPVDGRLPVVVERRLVERIEDDLLRRRDDRQVAARCGWCGLGRAQERAELVGDAVEGRRVGGVEGGVQADPVSRLPHDAQHRVAERLSAASLSSPSSTTTGGANGWPRVSGSRPMASRRSGWRLATTSSSASAAAAQRRRTVRRGRHPARRPAARSADASRRQISRDTPVVSEKATVSGAVVRREPQRDGGDELGVGRLRRHVHGAAAVDRCHPASADERDRRRPTARARRTRRGRARVRARRRPSISSVGGGASMSPVPSPRRRNASRQVQADALRRAGGGDEDVAGRRWQCARRRHRSP